MHLVSANMHQHKEELYRIEKERILPIKILKYLIEQKKLDPNREEITEEIIERYKLDYAQFVKIQEKEVEQAKEAAADAAALEISACDEKELEAIQVSKAPKKGKTRSQKEKEEPLVKGSPLMLLSKATAPKLTPLQEAANILNGAWPQKEQAVPLLERVSRWWEQENIEEFSDCIEEKTVYQYRGLLPEALIFAKYQHCLPKVNRVVCLPQIVERYSIKHAYRTEQGVIREMISFPCVTMTLPDNTKLLGTIRIVFGNKKNGSHKKKKVIIHAKFDPDPEFTFASLLKYGNPCLQNLNASRMNADQEKGDMKITSFFTIEEEEMLWNVIYKDEDESKKPVMCTFRLKALTP